jgi:hypothetical protein
LLFMKTSDKNLTIVIRKPDLLLIQGQKAVKVNS